LQNSNDRASEITKECPSETWACEGEQRTNRVSLFLSSPVCPTKSPLPKIYIITVRWENSIAAVETVQGQGKVCVLDIDVQGVQKVKKSGLEPIYLFIAPPSMSELEKRLRGRGTETEEQMQVRLGNAAKELEYGQAEGNFDRVFVNSDLSECFKEMVAAFKEWYPHLKEEVAEE